MHSNDRQYKWASFAYIDWCEYQKYRKVV
jgi:hypothetical protein